MSKMKKVLIVLCVLMLGGVAAYAMSDVYVSGVWRYKMTVTVETPEGEISGSAVREISNSASSIKIIDLPEAGNPAKERGEAVVVDLGHRGILFALISSASDYELYEAFPYSNGGGGETTVGGIKHFNALKLGMKAALKKNIPKMVTFTDMKDPKSVVLVRGGKFNPETQKSEFVDDFEKFFGAGVRLKSVTVEITDEPVTWGIEKYLGKRCAVGPYEFKKGKTE